MFKRSKALYRATEDVLLMDDIGPVSKVRAFASMAKTRYDNDLYASAWSSNPEALEDTKRELEPEVDIEAEEHSDDSGPLPLRDVAEIDREYDLASEEEAAKAGEELLRLVHRHKIVDEKFADISGYPESKEDLELLSGEEYIAAHRISEMGVKIGETLYAPKED